MRTYPWVRVCRDESGTCACVLTFSPDAPLVGMKGSYCWGICRNLCVTEDKLMEKNQKNPIRDAEMKERTAEWKPQRVQICVVTSRHLGTLMRTYQTSLACAVSLKDDSTEGENSFWYSVWHFSWYRSTQKSKHTFSPFCPWKTNT